MSINPDFDLKKVPLQAAVAYLISLHDNEVDWNLLGIRVIGAIDALPIPKGTYKYGDAYMVGTSAPYDMYIYTRADGSVHKEDYWFAIGKFPMPGPKGDKGDGFDTISKWVNGAVQHVDYNTTDGATIKQNTTLEYYPADTGSSQFKTFETVTTLPVVPGKYLSMNTNRNNNALEIKVDNTALALDYIPINKTQSSVVPRCQSGGINWTLATSDDASPSIMMRDGHGDTKVNDLWVRNGIGNIYGGYYTGITSIYYTCSDPNMYVSKTSNDTGTLTIAQLQNLRAYHQMRVYYDGQLYYSMDPATASNGTLNYIHIDSVQNNGAYQATGKCFSVTVKTRAWQVFDLNFGAKTAHNLAIYDTASKNYVRFTLTNGRSTPYTTADAATLIAAVKGKCIPCVFQKAGTPTSFFAGMIQADTFFYVNYGEGQSQSFTASQITIEDYI